MLLSETCSQSADLLDSFHRSEGEKKAPVSRDVTMESVAKLQIRLAPMLASMAQLKGFGARKIEEKKENCSDKTPQNGLAKIRELFIQNLRRC